MGNSYPELKTRIQSTFIDLFLMIILMFVVAKVLDSLNPTGESDDGLIRGVLFIAIWGVYEPIAMVFGSTLGNYLMKIRVREHGNTTKRINILQSYIRFVIKILLGWLSFITISANKERRAIHDLVSGSIMIEKAMN